MNRKKTGVIDNAGEIGVLIIDPHRKHMPAAADFSAELRPFLDA